MAEWRRRLPHLVAAGRVVFGLAHMVAPALVGRLTLGAEAARPKMRLVTRLCGGRDLAIGLVQLRAVRLGDPDGRSRAMWMGAACDAWDATAAWRGRDLPWWNRAVVGMAAASAAAAGAAAAMAPGPEPDAAPAS